MLTGKHYIGDMETTNATPAALSTLRATLASTQRSYATARALYETARDAMKIDVAALTSEPASEQWLDECEALDERHLASHLFDLLTQAEEAMVEACRAIMFADPKVSARYAEIRPAFEAWRTCLSIAMRQRMVDICYAFSGR